MDLKETSPKKAKLEESPLLASRRPLQSTINVGKLDQARFSEIRQMESDSHPIRIIIYVIIVVLVGLGIVLLVRNFITGSDNTPAPVSYTNTPVAINTGYVINTDPQPDSVATNVPKNSAYTDSALTVTGDSQANSANISLDKIYYNRYTTFARVIFNFTTSDLKVPKTTVNYDSVANKMTLSFANLTSINSDLQMDMTVSDLVKEFRFVSTTNSYIIFLSDPSKYVLSKDGDNLIIDFKTLKDLANPSTDVKTTPAPVPAPTPVSMPNSTTTPSGVPTAPHYTNDFSESKQYVVSNVTGNTIADNVYYVDNNGSSFAFSWGQKNGVGDNFVSNANAYLDDTSNPGTVYLYVELSNLKQEVLSSNHVTGLSAADIQNKTGVNTTYMNFTRVDLVSFSNGTAKYKFTLKKKAQFKLFSEKTVDGKTQVVGVEVKN